MDELEDISKKIERIDYWVEKLQQAQLCLYQAHASMRPDEMALAVEIVDTICKEIKKDRATGYLNPL